MKQGLRVTAGLIVGFVAGAVLTFTIQSNGQIPYPVRRTHAPSPSQAPARPTTYLVWTPNSIAPGFAARVQQLPDIARMTNVAEDNTWMTRSWSANGKVADHPRSPFMVPMDAAAIDPSTFEPFLPASDRDLLSAIADGKGVLGATSAHLRGLGPGSVLEFEGGTRVTIAGVLPDELVGAAELMVNAPTGARIGIHHDRYLLVQPTTGLTPTSHALRKELRPLLPPNAIRKVQVRAPGETPYFRAGDAVLPPVIIKALFGEWTGRPVPGNPGYIQEDPAWIRAHIVTTHVPLLGTIRCNEAIVPQIVGAMRDIKAAGLSTSIHSYDGCFVPRFINRIPTAMVSHHSWGIAFDCNAATNPFGAPPDQNPRMVAILERWGFIWGGTFIVPDGNHFEYHAPPAQEPSA